MAIRTYQKTVTVSKTVALPRTCTACGHHWTGHVEVTASHSTPSSITEPGPGDVAQAELEALAKLEREAAKTEEAGDPDNEVLCPRCDHFDVGAMQQHFPDGYAPTLLRRYRRTLWRGLVSALLGSLAVVAIVGLCVAILLPSGRRSAFFSGLDELFGGGRIDDVWYWVGIIGWTAVLLGLTGYWAIRGARRFLTTSVNYRRVKRMLKGSSWDGLRMLVVRGYRAGGNSLVGSEDVWVATLTDAC